MTPRITDAFRRSIFVIVAATIIPPASIIFLAMTPRIVTGMAAITMLVIAIVFVAVLVVVIVARPEKAADVGGIGVVNGRRIIAWATVVAIIIIIVAIAATAVNVSVVITSG